MSEAIKEQAKEYYPDWWSMARLLALKEKGKLTDAEIQEIVASSNSGDAGAAGTGIRGGNDYE